jgi:hypothetical protein
MESHVAKETIVNVSPKAYGSDEISILALFDHHSEA